MLNALSVKASVGFRDVDWAVEEKKSQRRKTKQQLREQRKTQRKMSNQELTRFLQYVVLEKGSPISLMKKCGLFLEELEDSGIVAFPEGLSNVEKVKLSLEHFDITNSKPSHRTMLQSWVYTAKEKGLFTEPVPSSLSSPGRTSSISGLSSIGTLETISLSSGGIDDKLTAAIIQAAVTAAYKVGKKHGFKTRKICQDLNKIFTPFPEFYEAFTNASEATEEINLDDGDENNTRSSASHASETFNMELRAAYTAFHEETDKAGLSQTQINNLNTYCFLPLQR